MQTSALDGAVRKVSQTVGRAAAATTTAAGAVGGAAVNGVLGGVTGTVTGVKRGVSAGSHSTPAAVLTAGAIGVSGLVEWPLVLAVGGGALLLRQLNRQDRADKAGQPDKAVLKSVPTPSAAAAPKKSTRAKTAPAKSPRSNPRRPAPAKRVTARR